LKKLNKAFMKSNSKLLFAAAVLLASCQKESMISKETPVSAAQNVSQAMIQEGGNNPDEIMLSNPSKFSRAGHVYIESNDSNGNAIVVYNEGSDGMLTWNSITYSGGKGTGKGLGSQSALALNNDHTWLFAVNAGSNSVSSFKIRNDGTLQLRSTVSSGGTFPVSVCVYNNWVYVVNSTTADINGYIVGLDGSLTPINGSHKNLSDITALPAQIAFSPHGNSLLVTEKTTSKVSTFKLDNTGAVTKAIYANSVGEEPFGFDFSRNSYMIVSNAFQGADNASSCTSYTNLGGGVMDVNGSVPNFQSAACWVATTKYGRLAFVANAKTSNITSYYVDSTGAIYYLPWATIATGTAPIDLVVSGDNLYVYNISSGDHTIREFSRAAVGTLKAIGSVMNIPASAAGIVAD
jgi:6-phosphogluconolactonase (cycloisomerase 2 family)